MNSKTYLGTAAAMTLCLGAVPRSLRITNLATGLAPVMWREGFLANSAVAGGIIDVAGTYTPQTILQGVQPYFGGDLVASQSNNVVVDALINSALNINYAPSGSLFTMDTAANGTGHFNQAMTSGAGAGSAIVMSYYDANGLPQTWSGRIAALNSTGLIADYVTLTPGAPNVPGGARIVSVGPQYDLVAAPVGMVLVPGVKLINTTYMTPAVQLLIEWE